VLWEETDAGPSQVIKSISPSHISRVKYGRYDGGNEAAEAGNKYHKILSQKLKQGSMDGDLGLVRRLPHGREIPVSGYLGSEYEVNARLDNVLASIGGEADVVEGKSRGQWEDVDIATAACTTFAIMRSGKFSSDVRFYYCYGYGFRLIRINLGGMLYLEQPMEVLAEATLACLGYLPPGHKSRKKDELKGNFTFAFENFVRMAFPYFG